MSGNRERKGASEASAEGDFWGISSRYAVVAPLRSSPTPAFSPVERVKGGIQGSILLLITITFLEWTTVCDCRNPRRDTRLVVFQIHNY